MIIFNNFGIRRGEKSIKAQADNFMSNYPILGSSRKGNMYSSYTTSPSSSFGSVVSTVQTRKDSPQVKFLMLHGFGQNGSQFKDECQSLTHLISLSFYESSSFNNYPNGIDFLFPTAPIPASSRPLPGGPRSTPHRTPDNAVQSSAWWLSNDLSIQQHSLNLTFQYLKSYLNANGPIDGVIGFDQGAALAAIVASWFESSSSISRLTSLSLLQSPLSVPLPASQMQPLKFVVCVSGWQLSSMEPSCDYRGFYEPKIETKTLVVMGVLDQIVGDHLTRELLGSLKESELVVHEGGHEVPGKTADDTVGAIAEFIERCFEDQES